MKDLSFDTGMIELAIQGDENRILRFNPSDSKIAEGFINLINATNLKLKQLTDETKKACEIAETDLEKVNSTTKLNLEVDAFFRSELDKIFGIGTSQTVFEKLCTSATGSNGECIFVNFIYALMPYFEKEVMARNEKISKIIQENKA